MRFSGKFEPLSLICFLLLSTPGSATADPKGNLDKDPTFVVQVKDQLLTVKVKDIPLKKILREIADQAWVKIVFHGSTEGLLSANFSTISLDEGLKRLSRDTSHAFIFARKKTKVAEPEIKEIVIYPKGGESAVKRLEPTIINGEEEALEEQRELFLVSLFKTLEDKDPLVREAAVDFLSEFRDERVMEHLTEVVLEDQDEDVRARAARALGEFRDERTIDSLIEALQDEEVWVRENVIQALGQIGGQRVVPPLMEALGDEDRGMRDLAAHVLEELKEGL